ncbi:MAG: GGDEF domain-containing protein [Gammaproteobacteria bacterium]
MLGALGIYFNHTALPHKEQSRVIKSAARLAGIILSRGQDQKRIQRLAYTDELIGLASRARFDLRL